VALPSKFRKELGQKPIVAKWYEDCLVIVSKANWNVLLQRLTGEAAIITAPVRDTDRFILGSAYELEPDNQGRMIIPESLASYASLKEEIIFLGLGERVEVWDKQDWKKREGLIADKAANLIEEIAKNEKEGR